MPHGKPLNISLARFLAMMLPKSIPINTTCNLLKHEHNTPLQACILSRRYTIDMRDCYSANAPLTALSLHRSTFGQQKLHQTVAKRVPDSQCLKRAKMFLCKFASHLCPTLQTVGLGSLLCVMQPTGGSDLRSSERTLAWVAHA